MWPQNGKGTPGVINDAKARRLKRIICENTLGTCDCQELETVIGDIFPFLHCTHPTHTHTHTEVKTWFHNTHFVVKLSQHKSCCIFQLQIKDGRRKWGEHTIDNKTEKHEKFTPFTWCDHAKLVRMSTLPLSVPGKYTLYGEMCRVPNVPLKINGFWGTGQLLIWTGFVVVVFAPSAPDWQGWGSCLKFCTFENNALETFRRKFDSQFSKSGISDFVVWIPPVAYTDKPFLTEGACQW